MLLHLGTSTNVEQFIETQITINYLYIIHYGIYSQNTLSQYSVFANDMLLK